MTETDGQLKLSGVYDDCARRDARTGFRNIPESSQATHVAAKARPTWTLAKRPTYRLCCCADRYFDSANGGQQAVQVSGKGK
jgi:hypothetical protein